MEREYVVISKRGIDVETIDDDLGIETKLPNMPDRAVKKANPRIGSKRMTHWILSDEEAALLRNDPRIESVEIHPEHNQMIKIGTFANQAGNFYRYKESDLLLNTTVNWGLKRTNELSNTYAGNTTINGDYLYALDGTGIDIVIQDSGIQSDHPEWEDSQGNSRLKQIDWYVESGISGQQHPNFYSDTSGHGTHVAGIAAGKTYGWAKNAHIYSQKLDTLKGSGDTSTGISSIDAFDMIRLWHINKTNGRPTVVNMSWGSSYGLLFSNLKGGNYRGSDWTWGIDVTSESDLWDNYGIVSSYNGYNEIPAPDATLRTEIEEMLDDGIHVVIAAGNSYYKADIEGGVDYNNFVTFTYDSVDYDFYYHRQGSPDSPFAFNVGNIDSSQWDVEGSNYYEYSGIGPTILDIRNFSSVCGPAVDIWAPGSNITSACSTISEMTIMNYPFNSTYKITTISGTSMAAPQITGICALYLQSEPSLTTAQLKQKILNDSKVVVMDTVDSGNNPIYRHPACTNGSNNNMVFSRYGKQNSWTIVKN